MPLVVAIRGKNFRLAMSNWLRHGRNTGSRKIYRKFATNGFSHFGLCCVCILLQDLEKLYAGGTRIVEDMCCEICVDRYPVE